MGDVGNIILTVVATLLTTYMALLAAGYLLVDRQELPLRDYAIASPSSKLERLAQTDPSRVMDR